MMQMHPNCLTRLGNCLFLIRGSLARQCGNTKAATRIMRDVLADGKVVQNEIPDLRIAQQLIGAEHEMNLTTTVHATRGQQYLERTEDWAEELSCAK
jgi:hypothetical protein